MNVGRARLLIVGLDAAAPSLVEPWAREGKLSTLAGLITAGTWAPLRSVPNMFTPAAWSTFATGLNPGRHGIFAFSERLPGSFRRRFVNGSMRDGTPFWRLLDQEGFRVGVMNVPMTYPAETIDGLMIAGMDAPDAFAPGFTHPANLIADLEPALGKYPHMHKGFGSSLGREMLRGRVEGALNMHLQWMEARTRWAEHLLRRYDLDVFVFVLGEVDTAQHFFWKYQDPRHPEYTPEAASRYGRYILHAYEKADECVRRLRRAFGEPADVMVVSDHGAGIDQTPGHYFLQQFLRAIGFEVLAVPKRRWPSAVIHDAIRKPCELLVPRLSDKMRAEFRQKLPRLFSAIKGYVKGRTVWAQTRAYTFSPYDGGIYVNVKGRDPAGIVEPGGEYETVRDQIIENLMACVDPITGARIVEWARRREELYTGPYVDRAPDICVRLHDGIFNGFRVGDIQVLYPRARPDELSVMHSGTHRPDGILILAGPSIKPGACLDSPTLADIAPTILYALNCPVPNGLDGRVLLEAFREGMRAHPIRWGAVALDHKTPRPFTESEEAVIEERLRALGYI